MGDTPVNPPDLHPHPANVDFAVGDVVLAFHGQLLYEAKVLDVDPETPIKWYRVRYQGWKKSWDDDIPSHQVVVHNNDNLLIAHKLLESAKSRHTRAAIPAVPVEATKWQNDTSPLTTTVATKASSAVSATGDAATPATNPVEKLQAPETNTDQEPTVTPKHRSSQSMDVTEADQNPEGGNGSADGSNPDDQSPGTRVGTRRPRNPPAEERGSPVALFELPASLKRQLVDDWEFITKENRLVPLPRSVTVAKLLKEWLASRPGGPDRASKELAESLLDYFDALLPKVLLYRFERPQYHSLFNVSTPGNENLTPSTVYGAEHLLRMFMKLPYLLEEAMVDPVIMQEAATYVNEIAKFIQKNGRTVVLIEYEPATPEYLAAFRQAEST